MSEFLKGVPSGEYGVVHPADPESNNGHAKIVDIGSYRNRRVSRQWRPCSHRVAEALLIIGIGGIAAIGAFEGLKVLQEAIDSIPAEIGYSQPSTQPNTADVMRFSLRNP